MGPTKLKRVLLASDVHFLCLTHALSTEVEEVMGLLIGWINEPLGICYITHCVQLKRMDKRKDRVEISTDQLMEMFPVVEELNQERNAERVGSGDHHKAWNGPIGMSMKEAEAGSELRVVGWYHSHPHITVFPSQVDIRTQTVYQNGDPFWVGLIFGVFNEDKKGVGNVPYIAFQGVLGPIDSDDSGSDNDFLSEKSEGLRHRLIPLNVVSSSQILLRPRPIGQTAIEGLIRLLQLLFEEVDEVYHRKRAEQDPANGVSEFHSAAVFAQSSCNVIANLGQPFIQAFNDRAKANDAAHKSLPA